MDSGSGTCRDFALFLMEAVRSLGFAARFVSGYLYDEDQVGDSEDGVVGGGATHAWAQIYLPGAGWVEFDPTNALVGGRNLIRVAVARDPTQAIPLAGSFTGASNAYLGHDRRGGNHDRGVNVIAHRPVASRFSLSSLQR